MIEILHSRLILHHALQDMEKAEALYSFDEHGLDKIGRYTFARILAILGETFKQLPDYARPEEIAQLLKIIEKVRDHIAHQHKNIF